MTGALLAVIILSLICIAITVGVIIAINKGGTSEEHIVVSLPCSSVPCNNLGGGRQPQYNDEIFREYRDATSLNIQYQEAYYNLIIGLKRENLWDKMLWGIPIAITTDLQDINKPLINVKDPTNLTQPVSNENALIAFNQLLMNSSSTDSYVDTFQNINNVGGITLFEVIANTKDEDSAIDNIASGSDLSANWGSDGTPGSVGYGAFSINIPDGDKEGSIMTATFDVDENKVEVYKDGLVTSTTFIPLTQVTSTDSLLWGKSDPIGASRDYGSYGLYAFTPLTSVEVVKVNELLRKMSNDLYRPLQEGSRSFERNYTFTVGDYLGANTEESTRTITKNISHSTSDNFYIMTGNSIPFVNPLISQYRTGIQNYNVLMDVYQVILASASIMNYDVTFAIYNIQRYVHRLINTGYNYVCICTAIPIDVSSLNKFQAYTLFDQYNSYVLEHSNDVGGNIVDLGLWLYRKDYTTDVEWIAALDAFIADPENYTGSAPTSATLEKISVKINERLASLNNVSIPVMSAKVSYSLQDGGSIPTDKLQPYITFLSSLESNGLLDKGTYSMMSVPSTSQVYAGMNVFNRSANSADALLLKNLPSTTSLGPVPTNGELNMYNAFGAGSRTSAYFDYSSYNMEIKTENGVSMFYVVGDDILDDDVLLSVGDTTPDTENIYMINYDSTSTSTICVNYDINGTNPSYTRALTSGDMVGNIVPATASTVDNVAKEVRINDADFTVTAPVDAILTDKPFVSINNLTIAPGGPVALNTVQGVWMFEELTSSEVTQFIDALKTLYTSSNKRLTLNNDLAPQDHVLFLGDAYMLSGNSVMNTCIDQEGTKALKTNVWGQPTTTILDIMSNGGYFTFLASNYANNTVVLNVLPGIIATMMDAASIIIDFKAVINTLRSSGYTVVTCPGVFTDVTKWGTAAVDIDEGLRILNAVNLEVYANVGGEFGDRIVDLTGPSLWKSIDLYGDEATYLSEAKNALTNLSSYNVQTLDAVDYYIFSQALGMVVGERIALQL